MAGFPVKLELRGSIKSPAELQGAELTNKGAPKVSRQKFFVRTPCGASALLLRWRGSAQACAGGAAVATLNAGFVGLPPGLGKLMLDKKTS